MKLASKKVNKQRRYGFSLLELSIVIGIISIVAVMGLEASSVYMGRTALSTTRDKLATIDTALRNYYRTTGRLPCPAVRLAAESFSGGATPNYGAESCTGATVIATGALKAVYVSTGSGYTVGAATISGGGGSGATGTCVANGTVTVTAGGSGYTSAPTVSCPGGTGATWVAGTSTVFSGAVPVVELGLPISAGVDAYGSKINYVVTQGLTDVRTFPFSPSWIEVRSGKLEQPCSTLCQVLATPAAAPSDLGAAFVLYSNGADQRGSVTRNGVRRNSTALNNCLSATTTRYDAAVDSQNCAALDSASASMTVTTIPNNVIFDARYNPFLNNESSYFDDIVLWRTKGQL